MACIKRQMHALNGCSQNADIKYLNEIVLSSWDCVMIMQSDSFYNLCFLSLTHQEQDAISSLQFSFEDDCSCLNLFFKLYDLGPLKKS